GVLLFEPNDMESLADAVMELYRHPARAEEMGRKGADGVGRHYTAAAMAQTALELYDRVVRGESRSSLALAAAR
ncbi:MAG: hypothetical protein L0Y66_09485, partial [Myxococcaceae bacterium]|nr:hypothetical protein [Myxococcaceae bacterium]